MKNEMAKKEPLVAAKDVLEEIYPLLGDYFEGNIKMDSRDIFYSMPNGQKIILSAKRF